MCETYNLKEQVNTDKPNKVTLTGTALIFGRPTRNKIFYTLESAERTIDTWIGRPFLNSHDDSNVLNSIGHVEAMQIDKDKKGRDVMTYSVDVDPEEKDFIRKAKRKDIPFVSIQVLVDGEPTTKESFEFGEYIEADIKEGLELSAVLIPGDWETSGIVTERVFAERFLAHKPILKEQITDEIDKDRKEEEPLKKKINKGMVVNAPYEEDITTTNGDGLIENPTLGKKIKKAPEPDKITPDIIPGSMISKQNAEKPPDIDDVFAKKTNTPDATQDEQEVEFTYDKKTIPYWRKGGSNIPAPIPKGMKVENMSFWNHCKRPMIVSKNKRGNMSLGCSTCGKIISGSKEKWRKTMEKINANYAFVETIKAVRRR